MKIKGYAVVRLHGEYDSPTVTVFTIKSEAEELFKSELRDMGGWELTVKEMLEAVNNEHCEYGGDQLFLVRI